MNDLDVSLESHLILTLRPLLDIIPAPLSEKLSQCLEAANPTISYTLLQSISRWVRTEEGKSALRSKVPPLDPLNYNMVSLLAGSRTSPDKKFPSSPARSDGIAREISDRRSIIAVLNSLLSVICTGAATWWATQRTSWRDEWVCSHHWAMTMIDFDTHRIQKVLLSFLAAAIVAVSEITLYIIWESRRQPAKIKKHGKQSIIGSSVTDNISRNAGERSSTLVDDHASQLSTSIDTHQPSGGKALRQRMRIKSTPPSK
jgi:TMEM199 family protein